MSRASAVIVLGVSRSGTTLLRQMLNHHSELAIPGESYFIVPLWERYRRRQKTAALLADLGCVGRLRRWGIDLEKVHSSIPDGAGFAEVIQAVYRNYAESRRKRRFGDKTPLYIQHLDILEFVFPGAQYIHIVRDGRNAALSSDKMAHRPARFNWFLPRGLGDFAFRWRNEVLGARRFGTTVTNGRYLEMRYEDLVAEPEARLREISSFLGLEFENAMLQYYRDYELRSLNHTRLAEPPTPSATDWRKQMRAADIERFEAIAGDLLETFGYERAFPHPSPWARTRAKLDAADSRGRLLFMRLVTPIIQRSPAWRWVQSYDRRTRRISR